MKMVYKLSTLAIAALSLGSCNEKHNRTIKNRMTLPSFKAKIHC